MKTESPLQGDVLESILSHVPTVHLLPALYVSRTWRRAALSSIHRRSHRPWLFIHLLNRPRRRCLSSAYDPHSHSWHTFPHVTPPPPLTCPFLPLPATWPLLPPPLLHRYDALVALVGRTLILAGGVCDLGERTCSVESLSLDSASVEWENREPMPESLRESAAATWLAWVATNSRLYVLDRTGRLVWFDLDLGRWSPVRQIRLGSDVLWISAIGTSPNAIDGENRLVVVGLMDYGVLRIWEVEPNSFEIREIGSLPADAVTRIAGEGAEGLPAVGFCNVGGFGYLYGLEGRGEVFACEFGDGKWRWEGVGCPPVMEEDLTAVAVFGCAEPAVEDLISVYGRRKRS